jgi:hypothetical protein
MHKTRRQSKKNIYTWSTWSRGGVRIRGARAGCCGRNEHSICYRRRSNCGEQAQIDNARFHARSSSSEASNAEELKKQTKPNTTRTRRWGRTSDHRNRRV